MIDAPPATSPAAPPVAAAPSGVGAVVTPAAPWGRRRRPALAVPLVAPFMAVFDQFVVNVAIPTTQRDLGASFAEIQFVIAGYSRAHAVFLITGGRPGDVAGRRRLYLLGLAGFLL